MKLYLDKYIWRYKLKLTQCVRIKNTSRKKLGADKRVSKKETDIQNEERKLNKNWCKKNSKKNSKILLSKGKIKAGISTAASLEAPAAASAAVAPTPAARVWAARAPAARAAAAAAAPAAVAGARPVEEKCWLALPDFWQGLAEGPATGTFVDCENQREFDAEDFGALCQELYPAALNKLLKCQAWVRQAVLNIFGDAKKTIVGICGHSKHEKCRVLSSSSFLYMDMLPGFSLRRRMST